ncbi:hypothetical protein [Nocardia abscessus]|uniref:hypothetical protein n=1 Tax=Nocardia abscessus TaxID=120957 RepID=UPI0024551112|nr:hypothetical protein [Nocardia abscessus]
MRLLAIDYGWSYSPAEFVRFEDSTSVYDFDVVIWDPAPIAKRMAASTYGNQYRGLPSLGAKATKILVDAVVRRSNEFDDFLKSGKSLFVIARPGQKFYIDTGERTYSGTGRNRHTTTIVDLLDIWETVPLPVSFSAASGTKMSVLESGPAQDLLRGLKDSVHYEAVVSLEGAVPVSCISGTSKYVAVSFRNEQGGHFVALPVPNFLDSVVVASDDERVEEEGEEGGEAELSEDDKLALKFQANLLAAASQLATSGDEGLPDWAVAIDLEGVADLRASLSRKNAELTTLEKEIEEIESELREIEDRKYLISGYGRKLELEVRKVLELLGATVDEPDPGRDDWIANFPEGVAVVEVKGLAKSAAEKNAAQLEKWVSLYYEKHEIKPKGILVVNAWRDLPLEERVRPNFPAQMIPYATQRNHCLLTGLQLMNIQENLLKNPERIAEVRNSILGTDGVFPDFLAVEQPLKK